MSYSIQTWHDDVSGGTPISAERLQHMEEGIAAASGGTGEAVARIAADEDLASQISAESDARTGADSDHLAATDPHDDRAYADGIVGSESDARIGADSDHLLAEDSHGDRAYADAADGVHTIATDPHGDRAYADGLVAAINSAGIIGTGEPMLVAGQLGDRYWRTDTPTVANQRLYLCTTAGEIDTAVWTGIL